MPKSCAPLGSEKFKEIIKRIKKSSKKKLTDNEAELIAKKIVAYRDKQWNNKKRLKMIDELVEAGVKIDEEDLLKRELARELVDNMKKDRVKNLDKIASDIREKANDILNGHDLDMIDKVKGSYEEIFGPKGSEDHKWEQQSTPAAFYNPKTGKLTLGVKDSDIVYEKQMTEDSSGNLVEKNLPYTKEDIYDGKTLAFKAGDLLMPIYDSELSPARLNATYRKLGEYNVAKRIAMHGDMGPMQKLFTNKKFNTLVEDTGSALSPGLVSELPEIPTTLDEEYKNYKQGLAEKARQEILAERAKTQEEVQQKIQKNIAIEEDNKIEINELAKKTLQSVGLDTAMSDQIIKEELDVLTAWDARDFAEDIYIGSTFDWNNDVINTPSELDASLSKLRDLKGNTKAIEVLKANTIWKFDQNVKSLEKYYSEKEIKKRFDDLAKKEVDNDSILQRVLFDKDIKKVFENYKDVFTKEELVKKTVMEKDMSSDLLTLEEMKANYENSDILQKKYSTFEKMRKQFRIKGEEREIPVTRMVSERVNKTVKSKEEFFSLLKEAKATPKDFNELKKHFDELEKKFTNEDLKNIKEAANRQLSKDNHEAKVLKDIKDYFDKEKRDNKEIKKILDQKPWARIADNNVAAYMKAQSDAEVARITKMFGEEAAKNPIKIKDIRDAINAARNASEQAIARSKEVTKNTLVDRKEKIQEAIEFAEEAKKRHHASLIFSLDKMDKSVGLSDFSKLLLDKIKADKKYFDPTQQDALRFTEEVSKDIGNIFATVKREFIEDYISKHVPDAQIVEYETIDLTLTQDEINQIVDNLDIDEKANAPKYFKRIAALTKAIKRINNAFVGLSKMVQKAIELRNKNFDTNKPMSQKEINDYSHALAEKELGMKWDVTEEGVSLAAREIENWAKSVKYTSGDISAAGVPEKNLILKKVSQFFENSYFENAATYTKTAVESRRAKEFADGNKLEVSYDESTKSIKVVSLYRIDDTIRQKQVVSFDLLKDTFKLEKDILKSHVTRDLIESELKRIGIAKLDSKYKDADILTEQNIFDALDNDGEFEEIESSYINSMADVYKKVLYNKDLKKIEEFVDSKYKSILLANSQINDMFEKANNVVSDEIKKISPQLVKTQYIVDAGQEIKNNRLVARAYSEIEKTRTKFGINPFHEKEELDNMIKSQLTKLTDGYTNLKVYANDNIVKITAGNDGYESPDKAAFISHTYKFDKDKMEYKVGRSYQDVIADNFTTTISKRDNPVEFEKIGQLIDGTLSSANAKDNLIDVGNARKIRNAMTMIAKRELDANDLGLMAASVEINLSAKKNGKADLANKIIERELTKKLNFDRSRPNNYYSENELNPALATSAHWERDFDEKATYYASADYYKYLKDIKAKYEKVKKAVGENPNKKQAKQLAKLTDDIMVAEKLGPSMFDSRVAPYRADLENITKFTDTVAKMEKVKDANHMAQILQLVSSDMTGKFNNIGGIQDWGLATLAARAFAEKPTKEVLEEGKTDEEKKNKPKGTHFDERRVYDKTWVKAKSKEIFDKLKSIIKRQNKLAYSKRAERLMEKTNDESAKLKEEYRKLELEERLLQMQMNVVQAAGTENGFKYILAKLNDLIDKGNFQDSHIARNPMLRNTKDYMESQVAYWQKISKAIEENPGKANKAIEKLSPETLASIDKLMEAIFGKEKFTTEDAGFEEEGMENSVDETMDESEAQSRQFEEGGAVDETSEPFRGNQYSGEDRPAEKIMAVQPEFEFGREENIRDLSDIKETDYYELSKIINKLNFGRKINLDLTDIKDFILNETIQNYDQVDGGYNKVDGTLSINANEDLMESLLTLDSAMVEDGTINSFENPEEMTLRKLMNSEPANKEELEGYEEDDVDRQDYCKA